MFDPRLTLLNDSCHPNIEIVNNALQHFRRNAPDFALDVLQSLKCSVSQTINRNSTLKFYQTLLSIDHSCNT